MARKKETDMREIHPFGCEIIYKRAGHGKLGKLESPSAKGDSHICSRFSRGTHLRPREWRIEGITTLARVRGSIPCEADEGADYSDRAARSGVLEPGDQR
mmetsp:Transcript_16085/g.23396  ORF Transcript_16085/g.23396 Transcript_16085/m.23396 type:complete len:100 (-) Transcript_16085:442-741(-)